MRPVTPSRRAPCVSLTLPRKRNRSLSGNRRFVGVFTLSDNDKDWPVSFRKMGGVCLMRGKQYSFLFPFFVDSSLQLVRMYRLFSHKIRGLIMRPLDYYFHSSYFACACVCVARRTVSFLFIWFNRFHSLFKGVRNLADFKCKEVNDGIRALSLIFSFSRNVSFFAATANFTIFFAILRLMMHRILCYATQVPIIIYEMVHFRPILMNNPAHQADPTQHAGRTRKKKTKFNLMRHMCA